MNFLPTNFLSDILNAQDNNFFQLPQSKANGMGFMSILSKNLNETGQTNSMSNSESTANETFLPILIFYLLIVHDNLTQQINSDGELINNQIEKNETSNIVQDSNLFLENEDIVSTLQTIVNKLQNELAKEDTQQINNLNSLVQYLRKLEDFLNHNFLKQDNSVSTHYYNSLNELKDFVEKNYDSFELLLENNLFKKLNGTAIFNTNPMQYIEKSQSDFDIKYLSENLPQDNQRNIHKYLELKNNIENTIKKLLTLLSTKDQKNDLLMPEKMTEQIKNVLEQIKNNIEIKNLNLSDIDVDTSKLTQEQKNNTSKMWLQLINEEYSEVQKNNNSLILNKNTQIYIAKNEGENILRLIHAGSNSKNQFSNNPNDSGPNFLFLNLEQNIHTEESSLPNIKFRDEIFRQIEQGIFKNLGDGKKELTIKLFPPELGAIKLSIEVQNKEVSLTIHTDNSHVTKALNQHISNFEKSLDQQGLKVVKIEIREDLTNGNDGSWTQHRDFQEQKNKTGLKPRTNNKITKVELIGETDLESMPSRTIERFGKSALYIIA